MHGLGQQSLELCGDGTGGGAAYLVFELKSRPARIPLNSFPVLIPHPEQKTTLLLTVEMMAGTASKSATPKTITWQLPSKEDNPVIPSKLLELLMMKKATKEAASAAGGQHL